MFKTLTFTTKGGERQVYVTKSTVTEEQLAGGDDRGVVCLCIDESKAEDIAHLLNNQAASCCV